MKRRRLCDLYVRGKEVEINDGAGSVKIWLQKLNLIDRESVFRRAQAAKARYMLETDNEDSENFQSMYAQVRDIGGRDSLITLVVGEDLAKYKQKVQAQLAADEDTWGKDNYLQSLVDAWIGDDDNPGLAAKQAEDPNDPEAARVNDELDRFEQIVDEKVKSELDRYQADYADMADEDLWRKAAHRLLEMRGDDIFNKEFERQQLFYCVREPDSRAERHFKTVAELDDMDEHVRSVLLAHYQNMVVDTTEGKDSPDNPPSSKSSGPSTAEEVPQESGLVAAIG